jgi:hypothetical protein
LTQIDSDENQTKITEIIITQTNERISQEMSNLSADELKANVLAGIAPFFALLAVSQNWQFFDSDLWHIAIPFLITIIVLVSSFLIALYILKPKSTFSLWDPVSSATEYSKLTADAAREKLKEELMVIIQSMEESRTKNSKLLKAGYILLIFGSIGALAILLSAEIFGIAF